ncbi:MAG: hypothetical protein ABSF65_12495 [Candidatus Bathyarchaeia archaeon]|jgi:hypothetical protein
MEKITVNLLELSDYQRYEVLAQAKAYLRQQVEQERYCRRISGSILDKDVPSADLKKLVRNY